MRAALTYLLWPFVIGAGTYGTYLGIAARYPLPEVFLAVGTSMLACVLAAEQLIPRRLDWNALADRQSINDLGHALGSRGPTLAREWTRAPCATASPLLGHANGEAVLLV